MLVTNCNACAELPDGNIMLSFRKNSMIVVVDKKTKKIIKKWQNDKWGQQHDCQRLENGNVLFFANGIHVPGGIYSSKVIEIDWNSGDEVWSYSGLPAWSMFSPNISGAQRLPNGNTLINEGTNGRLFEVTVSGTIVWEYINPSYGTAADGDNVNWVFRAMRYAEDSPQIQGRLKL